MQESKELIDNLAHSRFFSQSYLNFLKISNDLHGNKILLKAKELYIETQTICLITR